MENVAVAAWLGLGQASSLSIRPLRFPFARSQSFGNVASALLFLFPYTPSNSQAWTHHLRYIYYPSSSRCDKIGHHPSSARSISFSQNESPLLCCHISSRRGAILVLKGSLITVLQTAKFGCHGRLLRLRGAAYSWVTPLQKINRLHVFHVHLVMWVFIQALNM